MKCKKTFVDKLIYSYLIIMLMSLQAVFGQGSKVKPDCAALTKEPKKNNRFIMIDSNTGKILGGATKFSEGKQIQIIFSNKNPFKYQYRFQVVSYRLETSIASAFLSNLPDDLAKQLDSATSTDPSESIAGNIALSVSGKKEWGKVVEKAGELSETGKEVKKLLKESAAISRDAEKFRNETDQEQIRNLTSTCNRAVTIYSKLDVLINLRKLNEEFDKLKKLAKELKTKIKEFETSATANDKKNAKDKLVKIKALEKDILEKDMRVYAEAINELKSKKAQFAQLKNIIKVTLESDSPFFEVRYAHSVGGPTGTIIKIFRKNLRIKDAKEEEVETIRLQAGESRISLSGGFGFSTIPDEKVVRQASVINDTLTSIFGYETESDFQPVSLIMLNGQIGNWDSFSLGISTGLALKGDQGDVEYVAAITGGLLKNSLFLSIGFHTKRVESLAGGFKIGQRIPDGLSDPIPTKRNWNLGLIFILSYKLR